MKRPLAVLIGVLLAGPFALAAEKPAAAPRPNILWITIEDWSPDLSCYGTPGIHTPHVDRLAAQGTRYTRAFTTAPVCSPSRSAMMTGFHQNYIGAHQHRTANKKPLPHGIRPIPNLLSDAGYFTCLMSRKLDLNFTPGRRQDLFDGTDWKQRAAGQPFFARVTFTGTHRSWNRDPQRPIAVEDVELPPYYADTPFVRRDWANGLEQMQIVDREIGGLLKRLKKEGLAEDTLVFFIADHGRCHFRGKQFLYDGGLRVPLIVRWPGHVEAGAVNDELVSAIDLCATSLDVAGVTPPVPLHGVSLFDPALAERNYVFAARDKMDDTHDAMRAVRSKDYKLILNLMPERPWLQYNAYKERSYPALAEMSVLHAKGELTPEQAAFFAPTKPPVELFDLRTDPHEVHNVADDPAYAEVMKELLAALQRWRTEVIQDAGVSDTFRAANAFPAAPQAPTVDAPTVGGWVDEHLTAAELSAHGLPPWYPTRTLTEWEAVRAMWEPYVFRKPGEKTRPPAIEGTSKRKL